jgi:putative membrane protein insertion efficiency factor
MKKLLLTIIALYQVFVSPILRQVFGAQCRYELSCSEYAKLAIEKHGSVKGLGLSFRNLLSCQPFSKKHLEILDPLRSEVGKPV